MIKGDKIYIAGHRGMVGSAILRGRSPFSPDRLHLHHLLVDFGFSHMQATAVLVMTTLSFITFVFIFRNMGTFKLLFLVLSLAAIMSFLLQRSVEKRQRQVQLRIKSDELVEI